VVIDGVDLHAQVLVQVPVRIHSVYILEGERERDRILDLQKLRNSADISEAVAGEGRNREIHESV
jgi:hypothetical protein